MPTRSTRCSRSPSRSSWNGPRREALPRAAGRAGGVRRGRGLHALLLRPCRARRAGLALATSSGSCGPSPCASGRRSSSARPRSSPGSRPRRAGRAERFGWIDAFDPVKFRRAPVGPRLEPGDDVRGARRRPGRGRGGRRVGSSWRSSRRLLGAGPARPLRAPAARSSSLVPVGVSGIAWLAGLRIVTARNLIGVHRVRRRGARRVLLPLPRRCGPRRPVRAGLALAGLRLRAQPDGRARRLRPGGGGARATPAGSRATRSSSSARSRTSARRSSGTSPATSRWPRRGLLAPCAELWVVTDVPAGRTLLDVAQPAGRERWGRSRSRGSPGAARSPPRPRPPTAAISTQRPAGAASHRSRLVSPRSVWQTVRRLRST